MFVSPYTLNNLNRACTSSLQAVMLEIISTRACPDLIGEASTDLGISTAKEECEDDDGKKKKKKGTRTVLCWYSGRTARGQ